MPTVLVIEDEANIRKLAAVNLSARGYHVIEAESAESGLAGMRENLPSLVLLDIKLPGMPGWDLLAAMANDPGISRTPVIIMTASTADVKANAKDYANVVEVLIKPFDIGDLIRTVEAALK